MYVHDLICEIQALCSGVRVFINGQYVRNVTISDLAYADDVTVLVETSSAMRGVLKVIDTWTARWHICVSICRKQIS